MSISEEEQALKNFLLDIECLEPLSDWTSKLNLFDVLKITRAEIRHSNMLSWLVNPNENHGLNDGVIKGFIQYAITSFNLNLNVFDILLMDCYNFIIQREWRNIDILAVSSEERFLLCIENKIDAREHNDQLNRYRDIVEETYPDYNKIYIFLSPDGAESSDLEYWYPMGYQDVLDIIEHARVKVELLPDAELLINNYIEAIRRVIVGDEKLAKICAEIYAKHQKALDLIFENKPDLTSDIAKIFRQWAAEMTAKGELEVVLDKCNKTYTRFKTKLMSEFLPDAEEAKSGWNTKNHYFYEIHYTSDNYFYIHLTFSAKNITNDLKEMCERIIVCCSYKPQKADWLWRIPFSTKRSKVEDDFSEERIYEQLNGKFDAVKAFEQQLKEQLGLESVKDGV